LPAAIQCKTREVAKRPGQRVAFFWYFSLPLKKSTHLLERYKKGVGAIFLDPGAESEVTVGGLLPHWGAALPG